MTISQPSPDRLIFHPQGRSIVSLQIVGWLLIFVLSGEVGLSVFAIGWLLSKILSKSFAVSYTIILNDLTNFILIISAIVILAIIASLSFYTLLTIFTNTRITKICTFDRVTPHSERSYPGAVTIEQRNILNRQKIIKIPFNEAIDLRLCYGINTPLQDLQILLITNKSVRPIVIGDFLHNFSKTESEKILQMMSEEVDKIREFINLPTKPSYLVDGKSDYSTVFLHYKSQQKIVEHTSDIFTFTSVVDSLRTTWSFDLNSQVATIHHRWAILKFVKTISQNEIRSVGIKRESSLLISIAREVPLLTSISGKSFYHLDRDRYSLIAILNDGSSFKCNNNYIRIFTSTDLSTVREFAELVRSHLNLPDQALLHLPNRGSRSAGLTSTKF